VNTDKQILQLNFESVQTLGFVADVDATKDYLNQLSDAANILLSEIFNGLFNDSNLTEQLYNDIQNGIDAETAYNNFINTMNEGLQILDSLYNAGLIDIPGISSKEELQAAIDEIKEMLNSEESKEKFIDFYNSQDSETVTEDDIRQSLTQNFLPVIYELIHYASEILTSREMANKLAGAYPAYKEELLFLMGLCNGIITTFDAQGMAQNITESQIRALIEWLKSNPWELDTFNQKSYEDILKTVLGPTGLLVLEQMEALRQFGMLVYQGDRYAQGQFVGMIITIAMGSELPKMPKGITLSRVSCIEAFNYLKAGLQKGFKLRFNKNRLDLYEGATTNVKNIYYAYNDNIIEVVIQAGDEITPLLVRTGEDFPVLSNARKSPGTATGAGKEIAGDWLRGTDKNVGLFPKSVADKLRGRTFKSFDEFRQAFWKEVANDAELKTQFDADNILDMKTGLAPSVQKTQAVGKNAKYILHHRTPINQGGSVYDMDNLYIVTPRYHKEILDPAYHYGYEY
jgi:hypothetical protein